ncbi:cell division protein FtsW [Candidatus Providencia siddallii]|uniref:Probable peptidoglycan glycosyltransferase FtsW n=1 Tax=Candidatus Providencia siddallii TaxID=1715285 RepID=A0ABP1CFI9_9GAMM
MQILYDRILLWIIFGLITIGFIMVFSASIPIGQRLMEDPFYFIKRDILYIIFSLLFSLIIIQIPMIIWEKYSSIFFIFSLIMLIFVLFVGESINGAARWIDIGIIKIQPAEFSKLTLFCYFSSYLNRKSNEINTKLFCFIKSIFILIITSTLLFIQPDLGTVIILVVTTLGLLFLAGVQLCPLIISISIIIFGIFLLILFEPYRWNRIISFLNPWKDPFNTGYQLTQSLMAFGRGKLFGQGLGNSIQKLEYLPEAHTDFIFSVLAEELGFLGVLLILIMLFVLSFKAMIIGKNALMLKKTFNGYFAYSIAIWFIFQSLINIGATSGILPTKGLTLPLISYGGSSFLIMLITMSLLLRIDFETRLKKTIIYKDL